MDVKKRFTHYEREIRRQKIAADVKAGTPVAEVMAAHGVSKTTVATACQQNDVKLPRPKPNGLYPSTYAAIAQLQNTDDPISEIAKRTRHDRSRVDEILKTAVSKGVLFPRMAGQASPARTEARRLLELQEPEAGSVKHCHKHTGTLEGRPVGCEACLDELVDILDSGANANLSLVQWKTDATKLLREAFGIAQDA